MKILLEPVILNSKHELSILSNNLDTRMNNEGYNYAKKSKNLVTNIARITPVKNAACKLLIFSIRDHLFFISFKRNACSLSIMISEQSFVAYH